MFSADESNEGFLLRSAQDRPEDGVSDVLFSDSEGRHLIFPYEVYGPSWEGAHFLPIEEGSTLGAAVAVEICAPLGSVKQRHVQEFLLELLSLALFEREYERGRGLSRREITEDKGSLV